MNMRNWIIIAAITLIFGTIATTTYYLYQKQIGSNFQLNLPSLTGKPVTFIAQKSSPTPTPSPKTGFAQIASLPSPPDVLGAQPATGIGDSQDTDNGIIILNPTQRETIYSPLKISGWSKIADGKIIAQVLDQNGQILGQENLVTCSDFEACPFKADIIFEKSATKTGLIELSTESTASTSPGYSQTVVVQF